ncbi:glycine--tRNA ligase subunit beta [Legionella maceachernii]|uniref:Glycine--tRNA ligase beta subunit n=1 Tax=Legionella maceachernii TaxID=466 RepID=A0A0W0WHQ1_9GAMM|nr:glycine--tRNA ligase subunit beta [Legionella maceachernii]KTD31892.1 glycyl-tRNA synthetase beta chain [Legionella maceachernii]SJZ44684.1 glycyl-tRNA synthetase beta chain [Legionella maceachernii]SUP04142.1 Glycine--tRNA ligase beta subunit [Legionella maceachernii]
MANDFLFELGCEELPSGAVWPLADALATHLLAAFDKAQIRYGEVRKFATPRRIAVLIDQLQEEQPSQTVSRRGPALAAAYDANGQATSALLGFAKSCGVGVENLTISKTEKGEWLIHETVTQGAKTRDLLPAMVNQALAHLPIPKPMRWGSGDHEFARPVHWAVLLYADEVVDCTLLGVSAGCYTYGHRFHHPQATKIDKAKDYESLLRDAYVIADFSTRRALIISQVKELAAHYNAEAVMPDELVDEVTSIVEWPQALLANFEEDFLEVPPEALIAAMQAHQKCFAMRNSSGRLLPHFITVANINSSNPSQVSAGNEKVMRARLSDAAFFFRQDKKYPLSHHIPATAKVVFQAQLGSLHDKAVRLKALMEFLAEPLELDKQQAARAAELSKCDLMTGMVGEFPELQGLMGYYYAKHDGEPEKVAIALNEQYMPRFAADQLPGSKLGLALSLADRLDTLVGIFAIGQKPSGVKDPFKLRRHALAVVRILMAIPTQLKLVDLIAQTLQIYGNTLPAAESLIANELKPFILERMQSYYHGHGLTADLVLAVRARQEDWLYDFDKRINALATFINLPEAAVLSAACKRVHNILLQAEHSEAKVEAINEGLLEEGAEKALFAHLKAMEDMVKPLYAKEDYGRILTQLASLREPVDAFFEHVMVMVDDQAVKKNRLNLLTRLQKLLQGVADISLLQLNL